jgi:hypothetical protein
MSEARRFESCCSLRQEAWHKAAQQSVAHRAKEAKLCAARICASDKATVCLMQTKQIDS